MEESYEDLKASSHMKIMVSLVFATVSAIAFLTTNSGAAILTFAIAAIYFALFTRDVLKAEKLAFLE